MKARLENENEDDAQAPSFPSLREFCLTHQEIVEPLLVFCTHGIGMRDTRCCSMTLRLFVSLVPEFHHGPGHVPKKRAQSPQGRHVAHTTSVSAETASAIREYISTEVLKACITSFHDPYFVEVQKELASLIGSIVVFYGLVTTTPKDVLLSLPEVNPAELERLSAYMAKPGSHTRQQRAIVLELLKDLKGVSIAEMGKLPKSSGFSSGSRSKKPTRSKMAQGFMSAPSASDARGEGAAQAEGSRATPDALEGVSNLFES